MRARVLAPILATALCALAPAPAQAQPQGVQSARLYAGLSPYVLGRETTLTFGFRIVPPAGQSPSPLLSVDLNYPKDLGIALSELGLASCQPAALQARGLQACPADSYMGDGNATVEIPLGSATVEEGTHIDVLRAPEREGRLALIFNTEGVSPVQAEIALPAIVLDAREPFGGQVAIDVPTVPSLPGASDVAVVGLQAAIGPDHLTYYERVRGGTVAYRPRGIKLPRKCPRGGFPFEATFGFMDGQRTTARAVVACPRVAAAHRPRLSRKRR